MQDPRIARIKKIVTENIKDSDVVKIAYIGEKLNSAYWNRRNLRIYVTPDDYDYVVEILDIVYTKLRPSRVDIVQKLLYDKTLSKTLNEISEYRQIKKLLTNTNIIKSFTIAYNTRQKCITILAATRPLGCRCYTFYYVTPLGSVIDVWYRSYTSEYRKSKLAVGLVNQALLYAITSEIYNIYRMIMPQVYWI